MLTIGLHRWYSLSWGVYATAVEGLAPSLFYGVTQNMELDALPVCQECRQLFQRVIEDLRVCEPLKVGAAIDAHLWARTE